MGFTRTSSGVANYSHFHGVDIVVFTEGRKLEEKSSSPLDDARFYEALIAHVCPNKTVKVKCVGNKAMALKYAAMIDAQGIRNEIVCVDRDFSGLTHSMLPMKCVVKTRGYSWENDLWTLPLCQQVMSLLVPASPPQLEARYRCIERRLGKLGALDASLQPLDKALLKKSSKLGGVSFDFNAAQPISFTEMRRHLLAYKATAAVGCSVCRLVVANAVKLPARAVIQGHIWSNAIRGLLMRLYRECTGETAPTSRMLLNLALAELPRRLNLILGKPAVAYYRRSIKSALT